MKNLIDKIKRTLALALEYVSSKVRNVLRLMSETSKIVTTGNMEKFKDLLEQEYIKGLSISGKTITYTKGDGTTGTITTQDTDTHYTTGLKVGASSSATANAAASNGAVYLNVLDNTTVRDSHLIKGSGATTVTSDANGVITISSTDTNTNTTYSAGTGISLSGTTFSNSGVRSITTGSTANILSVNTGGTTSSITINNVANATTATKATQDSAGQQINSTYIKGLSVSGKTVTYTKGDGTTGTITTQDTNTTYSAGAGLSLSSNKFANTAPIYYVKGTQTTATNAWTGALPSGVTAYADGLTINYYLPYAGTSTAATLNLGSLGAKNVYQGNGTGGVTTHYPAGSVIQLVYLSSLNSNAGGWKAIAYYNSNTTNTAGATNTSSKIFLVGATSQAASPQTYTHDTAYVGTDGCLYSNNTKVSVEGHTHSYAPNYQYSTTDLEAGTSSLTTGKLYIVYE